MSRALFMAALAVVLGALGVDARCPPDRSSPLPDSFEVEVRAVCDCCALGAPTVFRLCAKPLVKSAIAAQRFSRRCGRQYLRTMTAACRIAPCTTTTTAFGAPTTTAPTGTGLRWYDTCGYPVCSVNDAPIPGVAPCTTEHAGDPCATRDATCDPGVGCGVRLRCTDHDPVATPYGCPISRRDAKSDITYLQADDLDRLLDDIRRVRLARYRYLADPARRPRLGFVIDDDPQSPAVAVDGGQVDLYGYTSMAIAAIQAQQRRIDALEREVAELRRTRHPR